VEYYVGSDDQYGSGNTRLLGYLNNAIRGKELFKKDKDYVVMNGEVLIVDEHTGRMLAVTRRILNSEEDARDAVQDAFVSAFRNINNFEGGSLLSTWLHRIAVNAALMKLRTRRRKPERSIEELLPSFLEDGHHAEDFQDWNQPVDRAMMRAETRAVVRQCICELPENYRTVLILRDIEELDTDETAERLGMRAYARCRRTPAGGDVCR